jgi:hypothetical protein
VSSIKVTLEGDACHDLIASIDLFVDEMTGRREDIESMVADVQRMSLENQADLSLIMKKVGAVGILSAGGANETGN